MAKVSVDIPDHILSDLSGHIGKDKKFISMSDAIRTACRKLLDKLDEVDRAQGRKKK